jgi:CubicO group peptidase (beta-lactamase class C family)
MTEEILRLYEQNESIHNLYVSKRKEEIFNSQRKNNSHLINIRSMTKSIVSLLIGIALKEKYIKSIETPINYFLPDAPENISIRDLLTMSSGFDINDKDLYGLIVRSKDWVKDILAIPILGKGEFRYKGVDYHLLSAIISESTGSSALNFAQFKLFTPLGINDIEWGSDPQGVTVGSTGLKVSFDGLIKISQILLYNGFENNNEILPNDWINISTTSGIPTNFSYGDYGYGWWLKTYKGKPIFRALGSGGQQILIYPLKKISVIVTADAKTFNHFDSEILSSKILDITTS